MMQRVILLLLIVVLAGCGGETSQSFQPQNGTLQSPLIQAVYLTNGAGQIDAAELEQHPEVAVTQSWPEFQRLVRENRAMLWIDKDAVQLVDMNWLHQEPQNRYPLVLVGYNDALYSFRDVLSGFGISGPQVDWQTKQLTPGFSVWILRQQTPNSTAAHMQGYAQPPMVQTIFDAIK